jgi:putative ABC transport system permease protein
MIKNTIKIIWRHLSCQKWYSFIRIVSLTLGLSVFTLIFAYLKFEMSFDRFHKNSRDIYRVLAKVPETYMGRNQVAVTPGILAPTLKKEFPEVIKATRIERKNVVIDHNQNKFSESGFICVDPDFLEIFSFKLLKGDKKQVLLQPFTLLLTKRTAQKYFGSHDPVGEILIIDKRPYTVEGLINDPPANTLLQFDFITSFSSAVSINGKESVSSWNDWEYFTYVLLAPNSSVAEINEKLTELRKRVYDQGNQTLYLQPLVAMRHFTGANFEMINPVDPRLLYLLLAIGMFILTIACLNYINLSTAHAISRAKEISLRKVSGAMRWQLIWQFMGESVALLSISLIFSLILAYLFLPVFGNLMEQRLSSTLVFDPKFLMSMIFLTVLTGILVGFYPAIVISSFRPAVVLKAERQLLKGNRVRNILVVFQLIVSVTLIFSSLIILKQLDYILNRDIGFKKDSIVAVRFFDFKGSLMLSELCGNDLIVDAVVSNQLPTNVGNASFALWEGKSDDQKRLCYRMEIDNRFLDFYEIPFLQIDSSLLNTNNGNRFILNQAAVKDFGWTDAIGKKFGFDRKDKTNLGIVGGIVKDFNFTSLRLKIEPLAISIIDRKKGLERGWLSIKVKPENLTTALAFIQQTWKKHFPDAVFNYSFIDDGIENMYRSETKLRNSVLVFTSIAILIACLGLFGFVTFTVERSRKEIGIRKIFGANVNGVVYMFLVDFLKLVGTAVLIALPAGYLIMQNWLRGFADRIEIEWDLFAFSAGLAILIAVLTIIFRISKSANANPIDIIKYE